MNIDEIKKKVGSEEYNFLKENEHLKDNIILLGLCGSYAYGVETINSDLDLRGIALNSKHDILGIDEGFQQFIDKNTDTTIYSFNKMMKLLMNCNPNTIEILGLKPEHYLYISPIGKELIDKRNIFLSQKAAYTFGAYASSQFRKLDNKSARTLEQAEKEAHILKSIENAKYDFPGKFFDMPKDAINLYIDDAVNPEYSKEIFMDVNLTHYPLRDYKSMWSIMNNVVKDYAKLEVTGRNRQAVAHNKLSKHMMHLIRLYLMCLDILERGEIITYREKEHDFLMDIRNGKYLDDDNHPVPEFFEIVDYYEEKMEYAKEHTDLPEKPDYNAIKDFVADVNERVVKGEV